MEPRRFFDSPGRRVVSSAFSIASESDELCQPVHLLAALEEVDGPLSGALKPRSGQWLYPRAVPPSNLGGGMGYRGSQTVGAARQFAESRSEVFAPGHLAVALIDQADAGVVRLLSDANIDLAAVRTAALEMLGASEGLGPVPMPPLCPAGTHDRPPLPVDELDAAVWAVLVWRQDHLPLRRLKRQSDWYALSNLEYRAARALAGRRALDDDQRYSLLRYHRDRVEALAHGARPDLVETRQQRRQRYPRSMPLVGHRRRSSWQRLVPNLMVGWPTWFSNRRSGLRDKYFRLISASAYRGQPVLSSRR
jgi:hypothetical protein